MGDTLTIPCNHCDDVSSIPTPRMPKMPKYFIPHPALIYITLQEPYPEPSLWVNDRQFMVLKDYVKNEGGGCSMGVWDVYDVPDGEGEPVMLNSFQTHCVPSMNIDEEEFPLIPEIEALEEKYFIQTWAEDHIHFIGIGSCYDLVGSGFFSYDIETKTIHWMNQSDRACEGDLSPSISPDSGHILYQGMVFTIHGKKQIEVKLLKQ